MNKQLIILPALVLLLVVIVSAAPVQVASGVARGIDDNRFAKAIMDDDGYLYMPYIVDIDRVDIAKSTNNGRSWSTVTIPFTSDYIGRISAYTNGSHIMAVASYTGAGVGEIQSASSTDGVTWTVNNITTDGIHSRASLTYFNDEWWGCIERANDIKVFNSTDGEEWTITNAITDGLTRYCDIAAKNDSLVILTYESVAGTLDVHNSTDGTTWSDNYTLATLPDFITKAYDMDLWSNDEQFFAQYVSDSDNDNYMYNSTDGATWSSGVVTQGLEIPFQKYGYGVSTHNETYILFANNMDDADGGITMAYGDLALSSVSTTSLHESTNTQKYTHVSAIGNPTKTIHYFYYDTYDDILWYDSYELNNTLPVTTIQSLAPTNAYNTTPINVTVLVQDEDRENVTVYYEWFVDGVSVYNDTDSGEENNNYTSSLSNTYFSKGAIVNVSIKAEDDDGNGTVVNSAQKTVQNTPPVMSSVTLTPSPAEADDDINCSFTGMDADDDAITFQYLWYIDGVRAGTNDVPLSYGATSLTESIICQARPNDGTENGDWMNSTALSIGDDTPPNISAVTLSSSAIYSDSNIVLSMTCTDTYSAITSALVTVTKPGGASANSTLTGSAPSLSVSYTDVSALGNYTVGPWYCIESSGNTQTDSTTTIFSSSTRPAPSASGGGGGGSAPILVEYVRISNLTDFCGDGICQVGENPGTCWEDCKINYDTLLTCIWDEEVECNWNQTWFPVALVSFIMLMAGVSVYMRRKHG